MRRSWPVGAGHASQHADQHRPDEHVEHAGHHHHQAGDGAFLLAQVARLGPFGQGNSEPRFVVTGKVVDADGAMLIWEFRFRVERWGKGKTQVMRGVSHLKFAADGKVNYHRDYWDTGEELYMKLPVIGALMRGLKRLLAA